MARHLATVETIRNVRDHENADALELVDVRGWQVITKLNEVLSGDQVVYFEIDTMLDVADDRFSFLKSRGVRTDVRDGFEGHVLRTVKLRGQLSQGLVLPAELFAAEIEKAEASGENLSDVLGLRKWDPPLPAQLAGEARGMRPGWVPKTEAERIQNIDLATLPSEGWVASEKVDGTSTSFGIDEAGEFRVCTRNLELKDAGQTQWQVAEDLGLRALLEDLASDGDVVVLQGELAGPSIQANPLQLKNRQFFPFRLLVNGVDVPTTDWPGQLRELAAPILAIPFPTSASAALEAAEDFKSMVAPSRRPEGIVWRYEGSEPVSVRTVKAISNRYLLKQAA